MYAQLQSWPTPNIFERGLPISRDILSLLKDMVYFANFSENAGLVLNDKSRFQSAQGVIPGSAIWCSTNMVPNTASVRYGRGLEINVDPIVIAAAGRGNVKMDASGDWSACFRMQMPSLIEGDAIFSTSSDISAGWTLSCSARKLFFANNAGGEFSFSNYQFPNAGSAAVQVFTVIVTWRRLNNSMTLYVDGNQADEVTPAGTASTVVDPTAFDMLIGSSPLVPVEYSGLFQTCIMGITLWQRMLTTKEIALLSSGVEIWRL